MRSMLKSSFEKNRKNFAAAALLTISMPCLCTPGSAIDAAAMRQAMEKYLAKHGDFCLGKFDWPIDASAMDVENHTNDAVQMPVLEKLGLVSATRITPATNIGNTALQVPVTRYALTDAGRKFYLDKEHVSVASSGQRTLHHGDFCAGKLSLDSIVGWDTSNDSAGNGVATVTYTYKIDAAEWTRDADARRVFPMVERIVNGAGRLRLQQAFRFGAQGWVPVNSWE